MTRTHPLGVPNMEVFHANKMAHFTCILEPIFQEPEHIHVDILSMSNCLYICLKEGCKVLGPDSGTKWVIGAPTGVADTA
jgi:hypothetical protein